MQLQINTSLSRPVIDIKQPRLQIKQQITQCEVEYTGPNIQIDQQAAFNEIGLGDYRHLARLIRQQGQQTVAEGIVRRAQEGDRFANEMRMQDTVSRIAKEQMYAEVPEITVDIAPKSPINIEFHYAMNLRWQPGNIQVQAIIIPPRINWLKGNVQVTHIKGTKVDRKG